MAGRSVIVVGYALIHHTEKFERYLRHRVPRLTVIAIASHFSRGAKSRCSVYERGRSVKEFTIPHLMTIPRLHSILLPFILSFQVLVILLAAVLTTDRFDLYIGVDYRFAFVGALLKKIGKVRLLIYYSLDYYLPNGSLPSIMTCTIFRIMDRICMNSCSIAWQSSYALVKVRQRKKIAAHKQPPQIVVPQGMERVIRKRQEGVHEIPRNIVYIGGVREDQGLGLMMDALPAILREIPDTRVRIVGSGPYERKLAKLIQDRGLSASAELLGFVRDQRRITQLICSSAVGIALYVPLNHSPAWYADPGKVKCYLAHGVPVVVTKVPEIAREVEKYQIGIAIDYNIDQLVKALLLLLTNTEVLRRYRKNVELFVSRFSWENVLDEAFEETMNLLTKALQG